MTPHAISLALMIPGIFLIAVGNWPASWWRSGVITLGLVLAGSGGAVRSYSEATPVPTPGPPAPTPVPFTDFTQRLKTVKPPKADAQIIGALHSQFANSLAFDGQREKPTIANTSQMGQAFFELVKYRGGTEAPWSQRYPQLEAAISTEAIARGVVVAGKSMPLDATRRNAAVQFFTEVGAVLSAE